MLRSLRRCAEVMLRSFRTFTRIKTAKKMLPFRDDFQILAAVVRRQRRIIACFSYRKIDHNFVLGVQAGPRDAFFMPKRAGQVIGI